MPDSARSRKSLPEVYFREADIPGSSHEVAGYREADRGTNARSNAARVGPIANHDQLRRRRIRFHCSSQAVTAHLEQRQLTPHGRRADERIVSRLGRRYAPAVQP